MTTIYIKCRRLARDAFVQADNLSKKRRDESKFALLGQQIERWPHTGCEPSGKVAERVCALCKENENKLDEPSIGSFNSAANSIQSSSPSFIHSFSWIWMFARPAGRLTTCSSTFPMLARPLAH